MDRELKTRLRKRIPAYLLFGGMIVLVLHYWQKQPADLAVTYRYGRAASGLLEATMVYRRGATVLSRVRFSYRSQPARLEQQHRLRLPEGDHEVEIELVYGRSPKATRTVRLRRPLLVRGSGPVVIFLESAKDETT